MKTLREICKEAKVRQGITTQQLADETGISISTINNYFASASKAPSVYNAGDICAVLGVSLDRYFGIVENVPAEKQLEELKQSRESEIKAAKLEGNVESMKKNHRLAAQAHQVAAKGNLYHNIRAYNCNALVGRICVS